MNSRESIYQALFNQVAPAVKAAGAIRVDRHLRHWSDTPPAEQTAVFFIQKREKHVDTKNIPSKHFMYVDLYVYVNSGNDPNSVPSSLLNPILDAIDNALACDPVTGTQTLGGLVSHAWIGEEIQIFEGELGDEEVAIVPVEMLAV
jgi:hypothetical protein